MNAQCLRSLRAGVLFLALFAGCSIITEFSPEKALEQSEERCSDSIDNDGNGLVDCADGSCKGFDFCHEDSASRCQDGIDNDSDGRTDCRDSDCCAQPKCSVEPSCGERTRTACTDGLDNDNNGLTDCADFSCDGTECCQRLVPLIAESFSTVNPGCTPKECAGQIATCCDQKQPPCNHFDPQRWVSWGLPPPRVAAGRFTPNQPCEDCPASGLLSADHVQLSPGLVLEFDADLADENDALLSVGLADRVVLPSSALPCGGIKAPFPLLAGFTLSGSQLYAEVAGFARQVDVQGLTSGRQRFRLEVEDDGTLIFAHQDRVLDTTSIRVEPPYPWVRVLVQGHSAKATIDNLLLARRSACASFGNWTAGDAGPGPVFSPSLKAARFDGAAVQSPSVVFNGSTYLLYYTGRPAGVTVGTLGYTTSDDGQNWSFPGSPLKVHGELDDADLSDPMVIEEGNHYLMVYRSLTTSGPVIALATSSDGETWTRIKTVLGPGSTNRWDGRDVSSPALVKFRHRLYLWYVGRGMDSTVGSLGLAIADKKHEFSKVPDNPVLKPSISGLNDRGVEGPWVLRGGTTLHLWYVGHTWGGRTNINYAASEDGRNWVHFPDNPVVRAGDPALFGSAGISAPTVLDRWGTMLMWYGGVDPGGLPSIGQAVNVGAAP